MVKIWSRSRDMKKIMSSTFSEFQLNISEVSSKLPKSNIVRRLHTKFGAQSFTSLKDDLRQDINGGFAFSRCLIEGRTPALRLWQFNSEEKIYSSFSFKSKDYLKKLAKLMTDYIFT